MFVLHSSYSFISLSNLIDICSYRKLFTYDERLGNLSKSTIGEPMEEAEK